LSAGSEGLAAQDLNPLDPGAGGRREASCSQKYARDDELAHDPSGDSQRLFSP
jgi:hypothetical protein